MRHFPGAVSTIYIYTINRKSKTETQYEGVKLNFMLFITCSLPLKFRRNGSRHCYCRGAETFTIFSPPPENPTCPDPRNSTFESRDEQREAHKTSSRRLLWKQLQPMRHGSLSRGTESVERMHRIPGISQQHGERFLGLGLRGDDSARLRQICG